MAVHDGNEPVSQFWYVDTGCSNHMCRSKSLFSTLNEDFRSTVSCGDCSTIKAIGKVDIRIRTRNGFVETILNGHYVPNLKSNLLSADQLEEKGYIITLQNGVCEIYGLIKGAITFVKKSSNRLYLLRIKGVQSCFMAQAREPSWLWHCCYGHLSFRRLKTLY